MRSDIIEHNTTDWSGWERWLRGHLNIEFNTLHRALGQLLADEREKLDRKTNDFAIRLAKLSGAVDVLRGAAPAKFPGVKIWKEGDVSYAGDVVTHGGNTWQARCDTDQAPGMGDWACLARAGRDGVGMTVRGTYDWNAEYHLLDVVVINGSSFAP